MGTSAGPYGYTLTVWITGAVLVHARGTPTTVEALLFMVGAVIGFALVGAVAFRTNPKVRGRAASNPVLWGSLHFVPVAASIGAASLVAHLVIQGAVAWPLAGFTATAIYLTFVEDQITFVEDQITFVEDQSPSSPLRSSKASSARWPRWSARSSRSCSQAAIFNRA